MKTCTTCHLTKEPIDFYQRRTDSGKYIFLSSQCRECRRQYHAQWRQKNIEHVRAYRREYAAL